jgi:hypothetical protein
VLDADLVVLRGPWIFLPQASQAFQDLVRTLGAPFLVQTLGELGKGGLEALGKQLGDALLFFSRWEEWQYSSTSPVSGLTWRWAWMRRSPSSLIRLA